MSGYNARRFRTRVGRAGRELWWALLPRCTSRPAIARVGSPAWDHSVCERHRGHQGAHRHINYIWYSDGRLRYEPVPVAVR